MWAYEGARKEKAAGDDSLGFRPKADLADLLLNLGVDGAQRPEEALPYAEAAAKLEPGEWFGIPYGILVPRGWKNLWVAGRCASSDVQVHGSIRVQPAASMMGQAAGTAAVQSMRTGRTAADLDTAELVETLRNSGANLPQKHLSRSLTTA